MMLWRKFPVEYQMDSHDCGPAALKIIAKYYGKYYSLQYLRDICGITKQGVSLRDLSIGAENIGLRTLAIRCSLEDVINKIPFPSILFWNENHFVVIYKADKQHIYISDPMKGHVTYTHQEFVEGWLLKNEERGIVLVLEPTPSFKDSVFDAEQQKNSFISILRYFYPFRKNFMLVFLIMVIITFLQGILPFISKAVIDVGIKTSDINFINIILIGNITILISIMIFNILRDWILMHITARVNVALISDYLIKLMKLPVTFFENKTIGDILQRAQDHERIRSFIMNNSLSLIFSTLTFIVFSTILLLYNSTIFFIFLCGSFLYVCWVLLFLRIRKKLDWQYFELVSRNQSYWVETVSAIQDIKIYNYEKARRWKWESIQASLYKVNKRVQAITNIQNLGAQFVENVKNMSITFFCATAVIKGEISYGIMISTQFIIGMLNGPLVQFINFVISAQYAKISFLRMNEIRQLEDEVIATNATKFLPQSHDILIDNVMFRYTANAPLVLKNITLHIPENKVTAIVGGSGSGKSTLLKLLIRLYKPSYGEIRMGGVNVQAIDLRSWRNLCGVVMQDGKLFSESIIKNIVLDEEHVDYERLAESCHIARIDQDIKNMPKGFETVVGENGCGLSGGQKQRLLIARALYRNPKMLFLDEATNALDTINESMIINALNSSFRNRTVVVIAHRLSTIRNADQIVVLDNGKIVEVGNHLSLMNSKGHYFRLIVSQMKFSS